MWAEATRVASIGFAGVFFVLIILTISVKIMSFFCKLIDKKGGKK
ncbi:MAG TPA: OadG family transporter subunit [Syntrophorhabdaceae bacterium]|jgi:Na+-transporting methylmalonyl-CoA/oxaloacetate decarboxylase gamma subunit|nr:OadG family transporter subunit [Syntrophorhabdaceae bacterium]HOG39973.1 OadG family transporter subunit [Syntrophorhabdaceae bacterium]